MYNGISRPDTWPPTGIVAGSDPLPVPYLVARPRVVPIDIGRQLFVDDFLIEESSLNRTHHTATIHEAAPVLSPRTRLERNDDHCPVAAPFNDGAWYDPEEGQFKLWYHAGWFDGTALATSADGIQWDRPMLDVVEGTNAVVAHPTTDRRDGALVWRDADAPSAERFKMFIYWRGVHRNGGWIYASPDGAHWDEVAPVSECGDNTSFFYNPFRKQWVFSIRRGWNGGDRARMYVEHPSFARVGSWAEDVPVQWARADHFDRPIPQIGLQPQLYDLTAVAYESIMLGAISIFHGPHNEEAARISRPKINDVQIAYSRDGFHWHRPHRKAFIGSSHEWGDWNYGYIHAAGGVCLVVGEELWFYYGAFSGQGSVLGPGQTGDDFPQDNAMYAGGHTGLATLRRDGFVSMDAGDDLETLVTRLVTFRGEYLFLNVDNPRGELRVEVLDEHGNVIEPFTLDACQPVAVDSTCVSVGWREVDHLAAVVGRPVRFRFQIRRGKFYAFWVSTSKSGASRGYVAAGGPGFAGDRDL